MSLMRIRVRNAVEAIATWFGGEYWDTSSFHIKLIEEIDGEEVETNPLLFSPIHKMAVWNCGCSLILLLVMAFPGSVAFLALSMHSDSIPTSWAFITAVSIVTATGLSVKIAIDGIRWTQLLATIDADGVYDDIFDNGSGIGADNDDEGDEDGDEDDGEITVVEGEGVVVPFDLDDEDRWGSAS